MDNKYVNLKVFIWAIGVLFTLFMCSLSVSMSAKSAVSNVKIEQATIMSDLQWIKTTLIEIKQKIR